MLTLRRALRLSGTPVVAIVGAGGKTTALFELARALAPSIAAATAHLGEWQVGAAGQHRIWARGAPLGDLPAAADCELLLITSTLDRGSHRFAGLTAEQADELADAARRLKRPLLVEADGAKEHPLKAPAAHEPPIPSGASLVILVAGLSGLGQPISDTVVHRPQIFAALAGHLLGDTITEEVLAAVLTHPAGGLKNIPAGARRVVLLNQADTPDRRGAAARLARLLLPPFHAVAAASLRPPDPGPAADAGPAGGSAVHAVYEPVAAVVLAAGESSRFGRPKQLLDYLGRPFVRAVAETAVCAGCRPVIVVTGAVADRVAEAVAGLPVACVANPGWSEGQSTSVRAGLAALPAETGAAVFLLADQPHVPESLIHALTARHAETLARVVAPFVGAARATPTLFDRAAFPALASLTGDRGGRSLLDEFGVEQVSWPDPRLLLDVDGPEDYDRLLACT